MTQKNHRLALAVKFSHLGSVVLLASVLVACGPSVRPLDTITFGPAPLQQIKENIQSFNQLPQDDLKLLMVYLVINEKAKLQGASHSVIDGKSIPVVMQEAKTWQVQMTGFVSQAKKIAESISQMVDVIPVAKDISVKDTPLGSSSVMKISYQINNKTSRGITGLGGQIRYMWPDGKQIAAISVVFDKAISPGQGIVQFGHQEILVGSMASKEMKAFSEAPLAQLRWEFVPVAIRYDNNEVVKVPSL